jgi:hypothetical protein
MGVEIISSLPSYLFSMITQLPSLSNSSSAHETKHMIQKHLLQSAIGFPLLNLIRGFLGSMVKVIY